MLGDTLFSNATKNYTFRYAFMPRSVENQPFGEIELGDRGVRVTHANENCSSQTHFQGVKSVTKSEEFVLTFKDDKFVLDKLHLKIGNLKQTNSIPNVSGDKSSISRTNQLRSSQSVFKHPPLHRLAGKRGETKVLDPPVTKSRKRKTNPAATTQKSRSSRNSKLPKRQREPPTPNLPTQQVLSRQAFQRKHAMQQQNRRQKKNPVPDHYHQQQQSQQPVLRSSSRTYRPHEPTPTGPVGIDGRVESEKEYEDVDITSSLFNSDSEDE